MKNLEDELGVRLLERSNRGVSLTAAGSVFFEETRAVLARLYPQKPIRAVLLWTETLEYMEISAPALDAALASLHVGVSVLDPARSRS